MIKYGLLTGLCLLQTAAGQVAFEFEPLRITASRIQHFSVQETRQVITLDRDEIETMPAASIPELLRYTGAVHLQQRGMGGQTDFSLQGSSFEQVLILVDGIRMNDSQTGHHNAEFALTLDDIERIEVMPGHGSSTYGSDGYGGVIHIITRRNEKNRVQASYAHGSFNTHEGALSVSKRTGTVCHRLSYEKKVSDGYNLPLSDYPNQRFQADYQTDVISWQGRLPLKKHHITCALGYRDHDFAAYGFYAPWPSREHTRTLQGSGDWQWQLNPEALVQSRVWIKEHKDHFILDEANAAFYQNRHQTMTAGFEISGSRKWRHTHALLLGMEGVQDELKSTGLGHHRKHRLGFFAENIMPLPHEKGTVHLGLRCDWDSHWGVQWNPNLGAVCYIMPNLKAHAGLGRVFRAPSFTDLYYNSPGNRGDVDLRPESGWNYETGLDFSRESMDIKLLFFLRQEQNRIEWIKQIEAEPWQAENTGNARIGGVHLKFSKRLASGWRAGFYTLWMERRFDRERKYSSKYEFQTPRLQVTFSQQLDLFYGSSAALYWQVQDRMTDVIHLFEMHWEWPVWKGAVFVKGRNLLDICYEDVPGVQQPGRFVMAGLRVKMD